MRPPVLSSRMQAKVARVEDRPLDIDHLYSDLTAKNVFPPDCVEYRSGDQMTVAELKEVLASEELKAMPPLYERALVKSTRQSHQRCLRWLVANLSGTGAIDAAILDSVQQQAATRGWKPSTLMTKLTTIQGALKALFLYRKRQVTVQLKACQRWLTGLKGVNTLLQTHAPNQPVPITQEQVTAAMAQEPSPGVRAAIEVAWLTAGRGGDVCRLRATDFNFPPPTRANPQQSMTVTFRVGKTASRSQYTLGVPLPSEETVSFIKEQQVVGSWAFPKVPGTALREAVRRVDPKLEQRSFRRGRLQHLAKQGMLDHQLLELSRHATMGTLRRYLDMGIVSSTTHATAALAADMALSC